MRGYLSCSTMHGSQNYAKVNTENGLKISPYLRPSVDLYYKIFAKMTLYKSVYFIITRVGVKIIQMLTLRIDCKIFIKCTVQPEGPSTCVALMSYSSYAPAMRPRRPGQRYRKSGKRQVA